mgnify:CR=1 FL=1
MSALEIDVAPNGVVLPWNYPGEPFIDYISGYGVWDPVYCVMNPAIDPEACTESKLGSIQAVSGL